MSNVVNVQFGVGEDGLTDKERREAEKSMENFVLYPPETIIKNWYDAHLPFREDQPLEINVHMVHILGFKEAVLVQKMCELEFCYGFFYPHNTDPKWGDLGKLLPANMDKTAPKWIRLTINDLVHELGNIWGRTSVQKALYNLRDQEIVIVMRVGEDKTNCYRIDYDRLKKVCEDY